MCGKVVSRIAVHSVPKKYIREEFVTMKKRNLTSLFAALVLTVVAGSSLLCGNGIVSYEGEMDEAGSELAEIAPASVCTNISRPTVSGPVRHYCVTTYTVTQKDQHATTVEFYRGGSDRYPSFTYNMPQNTQRTILGLASGGGLACAPNVFVVKAKCPACGNSASTTLSTVGNYPVYEVYNTKSSGIIGTSYDGEGYVWDHGLSVGNTIHFSLVYQGSLVDDKITIPWAFTTTVGPYNLNGVDFWVRTGPNRISIKASQEVTCNNYDTVFAFSTSQDAIVIQ